MNENINLCELVRHCPYGEKFYCTSMDKEVGFLGVKGDKIYASDNKSVYAFGNNGKSVSTGEYLLIPSKCQPDWSKFKAPKFDPKTFKPFDKVLLRDADEFKWVPSFIDRVLREPSGEYSAVELVTRCKWNMCIPYNDETKHLAGTSEDCDEYYKWWEE